jgi:hypothetical protein
MQADGCADQVVTVLLDRLSAGHLSVRRAAATALAQSKDVLSRVFEEQPDRRLAIMKVSIPSVSSGLTCPRHSAMARQGRTAAPRVRVSSPSSALLLETAIILLDRSWTTLSVRFDGDVSV